MYSPPTRTRARLIRAVNATIIRTFDIGLARSAWI